MKAVLCYLIKLLFESLIYKAEETGGVYVVFLYDIKEEFGRGRVKVSVTFNGELYNGSIVNIEVREEDESICYIISLRKDIRSRIRKQPTNKVHVTIKEQE